MVTKGVLFLHDNALTHRALATQNTLAYLGFQCVDHPLYSPDLTPSDYHLFPGLKKTVEILSLFVFTAAETWLNGQPSVVFIYFEWLAKVIATG